MAWFQCYFLKFGTNQALAQHIINGCTIGLYLVLYIINVYTLVWNYAMHANYGLLISLHSGSDKILQCCVVAS